MFIVIQLTIFSGNLKKEYKLGKLLIIKKPGFRTWYLQFP